MSSRFQTAMRDNVRMNETTKRLIKTQKERTDFRIKLNQEEIDREHNWLNETVLKKSPDYDWVQGLGVKELTEMVKGFNKNRCVSSKETRKRNRAIDSVLENEVDSKKELVEQLGKLKKYLENNKVGDIDLFSVVKAVCMKDTKINKKRDAQNFEIWK